MMVFSELYGAYYNTVAHILKEMIKESKIKEQEMAKESFVHVSWRKTDKEKQKEQKKEKKKRQEQMHAIIKKYAFRDSLGEMREPLENGEWHLLREDLTTPIQNPPTMPLTTLQKSWLKAIALDPRIQLFVDEPFDFPDVEPLFLQEDICVFDRYADGDDYTDETYRKNFRLILDAIKNKYPLDVKWISRKGKPIQKIVLPEYLEYSEKDDKFRLAGEGIPYGGTVNLSRMISCEKYNAEAHPEMGYTNGNVKDKKTIDAKNSASYFEAPNARHSESVVFELVDERHALERVLLHFAHFKKEAEKLDETHYRVTVNYNAGDQTEIVIRILSFGPMIRVIAPDSFIELMKDRLIKQKRFL